MKGNGAVLLVEKLASISDSVIGLKAAQYGPSALRVTLYDKPFLDLEEVFKSGVDLEKVMFSPEIRHRYHENKPLSPGTTAQDITDPALRPFVRIVGPGANGAIRVRPVADTDDARAFERQPDRLLSGLPITMSINLSTPAASVREALAWLWPHGHVPPDRIQVHYADGAAVPSLDGAALLAASATAAAAPSAAPSAATADARFGFSSSAFAQGDCVVVFDGVPVRVLVSRRDATPRGGSLAGRLLARAVVLSGTASYYLGAPALLAAALALAYVVLTTPPDTAVPEPPAPGGRVLVRAGARAEPGTVRALLANGRALVALDRGGEFDLPLDALEPLPSPAAPAAPAATRHR